MCQKLRSSCRRQLNLSLCSLDDLSEAFNNGLELTQITGINNSGEITGFYSGANGVFHGFVSTHHRG
jgi:hypothetical protein